MALRILLNYRRGDTAGNAGRLYEALAKRFGEDNVFMDIDKIEPGLNFVDVIKRWVGDCDVFLAMIGTQWLDAANKSGQRRLDDPGDFVRMEIESALARPDVRLIPVLVQDVDMPTADQLPPSMHDLALRNGLEIRDVSWQYDVDRLIEALEKIEGPQPAEPEDPGQRRTDYRTNGGGPFDRKRVGIASAAALLVLAAIGGFLLLREGADGGTVPPGTTVADDGSTQLVYAGSGRLFIVDTDGSNERSLKGGRSRQPDWSPRGDRIAVNRAADIVVLDTEGNEVGRLTTGESVDDAPSWSPDQTRVAFDRQGTPGSSRTDVFVVDMDGNAKNLTEEPGRTGGQPDWSPDGERIVFQRRGAMFVMNADGTGEERLQLPARGAVHEPAWSPDGTQIAVAIDANPTDIYLFSLAGRTLRNLTDGRATNPRFPSWSGNGTLAFAAADGIWTINRDGSGLKQVIEGERLEAPSWRK
jgi:hypothetical protein